MMLIKTHIAQSQIHGLGVFASEFIPKGTKVWTITPGVDLEWNLLEYNLLPEEIKSYIEHYGYLDPTSSNYRLSFDNDRFMNWSEKPNVVGSSSETYAIRDILKDEELTYPRSEDLLGNVA